MIDLHIHTTYSDGTKTVIEILKLAEQKGIEVISITDHNTCDAYFELNKLDVKEYYSGKIIKGVELNTRVKDIPIEILVYDIDEYKMQKLIDESFPTSENRNLFELKLLYDACIKNNIILPSNFLENYDKKEFTSVYFLKRLKETMHKNPNINIEKECLNDYAKLYRYYLSNPKSSLYIDPKKITLDIQELIKRIRRIGGKIFIAHVFEYKLNAEIVLEYVINNCDIDGFECYHESYDISQQKYLVDMCEHKGFLISGGSDYHGDNKINVEIGTGKKRNIFIEKEILEKWNKVK